MSVKKLLIMGGFLLGLLPSAAVLADTEDASKSALMAYPSLAKQLGWVESTENNCGGYYLEEAFIYPVQVTKENAIEITSNQGLLAQRGTSVLEKKVTINRHGQQITSDKAYIYRDPNTYKLTYAEMIGDVRLREPNTLIVAKQGQYHFLTQSKSLRDILYRTSLNGRTIAGPKIAPQAMQSDRKINLLTAWGKAYQFSQNKPKVYELSRASFSTCPPIHPAWRLKASHIVLDKNAGRGYATHARLLVKNVPIFYMPYINFPIDKRRKSGFLWPTLGGSNTAGPYIYTPFYWNAAPNYDMVITPGLLTKRGVQLSDYFRYLTETSSGDVNVSVLPNDKLFAQFQRSAPGKTANGEYGNPNDPIVQAELNRLLDDSTTRKALFWNHHSQFNEHWSSHVDFNYAGDDYYLRDFGNSLNQLTENQLVQEGDLYYKGQNWNFTGRIQAYQTLHPIDAANVSNQYRRVPQLILSADYPDQKWGLEYFIDNDITHFDILKTPGTDVNLPTGNRLHTQPGISLPIAVPYFYVNPRFQLALTDYNLYQTTDTDTPVSIHRAVPIFDVVSGLAFDREGSWFGHAYQQTLEPQVYYTYIPYRNQSDIPIFDTTTNTLAYDQIFNYNRFSGLDRIGDANQVGVGVTSRFIDDESGLEKVRIGLGGIVYFANRLVTLCNNDSCSDNPSNHSNYQRLSPLSGLVDYHVNPTWSFGANPIIWDPISKQLNNVTFNLHYQPDEPHIINLGYSYARSGVLSGVSSTDPDDNLKVTDFSFVWPLLKDVSGIGRWSQNWNHGHLQNLIYGIQYDTCCWAVRAVGGRAFLGMDPNNNNRPQYNSEFYIQFSLKGLGNISSGNPLQLLSSIAGYNTQFGQEL